MADTLTVPVPASPAAASIAPGTGPATVEPAQAGSSLNDAFGQLESRGQSLEQIATARPPTAKPKVAARAGEPEQKPAEKVVEKPAEKAIVEKPPDTTVAKPADAPKPGDKPAEGKPAEKPKPATGWQKFHEAERQIKDLNAKIATLETAQKTSDLPDTHPEVVRRQIRIDALEKQLADKEAHLQAVDYQESDEYKKTYWKPYEDLWGDAFKAIAELKVTNPDGTTRNATGEEFKKLMQAGTSEEALTMAEELFGTPTKANFAMHYREQLRAADGKMAKVVQERRTKAAEIRAEQEKESKRQGEERSAMFKKLMTEGVEKDPALYKPEEGDNEGNALLEKGFGLVDRVFSGGAPVKDGDAPMSAQEMIAAHAQIRNDAAAFPRLAHKYKALQQRILELEESLSEYEASTAGKGEVAAGDKGPQREDDLESVVGGLDRLGQ